MKTIYRQDTVRTPDGFTEPTDSFKKHVVMAVASLLIFVGVYLGLMIWFGYSSYNLFQGSFSGGNNPVGQFAMGVGLAFLAIFMAKSLLIFSKSTGDHGKELTQKDEPVLFDYLYKLADEIGAPRPHRVFLTNRVNAAVFYDLSIWNLIFPAKKNLEIGLGLVNVLSVGELKAVLAHEFGHFAQRSMLLGRYVYTAQQIALRVVHKRDALDSFINGLSRIDLRIAWIGWILSILVWAIRSLIETLFSVVVIVERALSREMEFQADIVAVSVTGSDALIHALYKLKIADEAHGSTVQLINKALKDKKAVYDMFSLQTNYIEKMQWIMNDPMYGKSPEVKENGRNHRIFTTGNVNPPEMWATHPSDNDREENAKKRYLRAEINEDLSWVLFSDAPQLRTTLTAEFIATAEVETELMTDEASIAFQNQEDLSWQYLNPKYEGVYIGRMSFVNFETVEDAFDGTVDAQNLSAERTKLYTKEFGKKVKQAQELKLEYDALEIVKYEVATAEQRKIMHRGKQIKRRDIPGIMDSLEKEMNQLRNEIMEQDRMCRRLHWEVANAQSPEIGEYLKTVSQLVHYAEHTITDLNDAYGKYNNVLHVVLADNRVTDSELREVLLEANDLHGLLEKTYDNARIILLNDVLRTKLGGKKYTELFEEFTLPRAVGENIESWSGVIDNWFTATLEELSKLRNASLEHLLNCEEEIGESLASGAPIAFQMAPITVAEKYRTLTPGKERKLQMELGLWDRFHMGDGIVPSMAKFGISAAIIAVTVFLGNYAQVSELYMYNGLGIEVNVNIGGDEYRLYPHNSEKVEFSFTEDFNIVTTTMDGDTIEAFTPEHTIAKQYIYNVAYASVLIEQTVIYGSMYSEYPDVYWGTPRWMTSDVDHVMEDPPNTISTSSNSSGGTRDVIYAYSSESPLDLIAVIGDEDTPEKLVSAHCKYDPKDSRYIGSWVLIAVAIDSTFSIASERLNRYPAEVASWRGYMNHSDSTRVLACEYCVEKNKANPEDSSFYYLATRCIENEKEKDDAFIAGYEKWPENSWLAMASGYIYSSRGEWLKGYNALSFAVGRNEALLMTNGQDLERLRRYVTYTNPEVTDVRQLLNNSENVEYYRNLEANLPTELDYDMDRAYHAIAFGKYEEALNIASAGDAIEPFVAWMVAASHNASDDIVQQVLAYEADEGIDQHTVWMAIGTAMRSGADYTRYVEQLKEIYGERAGMDEATYTKIFDLISKKRIKEAERLIDPIEDFKLKSKYWLVGVIALEDKVPKDWIVKVNKLLFASERPYYPLPQDPL